MSQSNPTITTPLGLSVFGARAFKITSWLGLARLANQRNRLAQLDATRLADLGITPEQARIEANRPFWDAPQTWRA